MQSVNMYIPLLIYLLIPLVSASSWIVHRWSLWMSSQIFSTFSVILLAFGCPECLSSSTDTQPALKHECHSKTPSSLKNVLQKPHEAFQGFW
jgi:hypothetical protein